MAKQDVRDRRRLVSREGCEGATDLPVQKEIEIATVYSGKDRETKSLGAASDDERE